VGAAVVVAAGEVGVVVECKWSRYSSRGLPSTIRQRSPHNHDSLLLPLQLLRLLVTTTYYNLLQLLPLAAAAIATAVSFTPLLLLLPTTTITACYVFCDYQPIRPLSLLLRRLLLPPLGDSFCHHCHSTATTTLRPNCTSTIPN